MPHNPTPDPSRPIPLRDVGRVSEREMEVAREIAESFLTARSALEVYRRALARLTPLVGATFASVFLRDDEDPRLLRLACAQNWPQTSARFLSEIRVREGRGPTGRAFLHGESVEVEDVFADESLEEWWEPARELGFVSMTAHPLTVDGRVFGSLSFYFAERQSFDQDDRTLLAVVAHQLASTAERAHLAHDLQSVDLAMERENTALMEKMAAVEALLERQKREREGSGPED